MKPNDLPIVCIPLDLPEEAAASLVEFLQDLTAALEGHYFAQLHRHYQARKEKRPDPDDLIVGVDPDPPF
jgi:hypothetical protein